MTILANTIYSFKAIPIKLSMAFFTVVVYSLGCVRTKILQFVWKCKRPHIVKAILRKKNRTGGTRLFDFKLSLQSNSHEDGVVLKQKQKYRSMECYRKLRNKPTHLWSINLTAAGRQ